MKYNRNNQQGSALISALIIVMLIASVTTAWISQTHFHVRYQKLINENAQATWLADGAKIWTVQILKKTKFKQTNPILATLHTKNIPLPPQWKIEAQISDAQALVNLNTISEQSMRLTYYLLIKDLLGDSHRANINDIYYASITWLDPSLLRQRYQEFKAQYAQKKPPYLPGGQPMQTLDEYRLISGMTPQIFKILKPYITVIPESVPINLNTCDEKIIKSLRPGLKDNEVKKIIYARGTRGFSTNNELFAVLQEFKIPVQNVTTQSQYFWLRVKITAPSGRRFISKYLIYRRLVNKTKNTKVVVLQQFTND
jgi:general secretion pathway protein K